jgi:CheY-like chemotaxis protein
MPVMDGYQATAKIRSDARFSTLPIIAMTAHATSEERQRCLATGMNDHISKPVDPENLFEIVGRFYSPADLASASPRSEGSTPLQANNRDRESSPALPAAGESKRSEVRAPQPDNLPAIDGLDTKDGLSRVAGNRKLYLRLLRQFLDQQGTAPAQIADALARTDTSAAERLAHTVKGVAGNLGARPIHQMAAKLEKAISEKTPSPQLTQTLSEFRSALEDFVDRLRAALPSVETVTPATPFAASVDLEQAKRVVQEMVAHLNNFDPAASECLENNCDVFRALFPGEQYASFEQQISGFAFAEALARLEPAAKEKGFLPA